MNNFIFSSLVYYLSLQRCSTYNDFSIHGLWPDYIDGGYPQFCTNQQFNLSTIEPIMDDLNKYWNSCIGKSVVLGIASQISSAVYESIGAIHLTKAWLIW